MLPRALRRVVLNARGQLGNLAVLPFVSRMSTVSNSSTPIGPSKPSSSRAIIFVLAIIALAALSNPPKQRHDKVIREQVRKSHPVLSLFGGGRLASWVAGYHSVGIASYTTIDNEVVTFGAFGIVVPR